MKGSRRITNRDGTAPIPVPPNRFGGRAVDGSVPEGHVWGDKRNLNAPLGGGAHVARRRCQHLSDGFRHGRPGFRLRQGDRGPLLCQSAAEESGEACQGAECVVGFYHFLWPGHAKEQAAYFLENTPEKEGDLLAVDWEQTGEGTRAGSADKDRFIREVKRLRPQHRVLLYCNRSFWINHDTSAYAGDGLWIADYGKPAAPRIDADWRIHQYTDDPIDKNVADFSSRQAMRDWATA